METFYLLAYLIAAALVLSYALGARVAQVHLAWLGVFVWLLVPTVTLINQL